LASEIPIKKLESESDTWPTVVCRSAAISANAGRYISMENGPMAVIIPNTSMVRNFLFFVITLTANVGCNIVTLPQREGNGF
jgi:hypothetical protein